MGLVYMEFIVREISKISVYDLNILSVRGKK